MQLPSSRIRTIHELEDRYDALRDSAHAGRLLAGLLEGIATPPALIVAVVPGGLAIAAAMAARLRLPVQPATATTIEVPWDPSVWLGAVAFDGTAQLDPARTLDAGLSANELDAAVASAVHRATDAERQFRSGQRFPPLTGRPAILVDDGLSPTCVVRVLIAAIENAGASRVLLALATGKSHEIRRLARRAYLTCCANLHHDGAADLARAYRRQLASLSSTKP